MRRLLFWKFVPIVPTWRLLAQLTTRGDSLRTGQPRATASRDWLTVNVKALSRGSD